MNQCLILRELLKYGHNDMPNDCTSRVIHRNISQCEYKHRKEYSINELLLLLLIQ